VLTSHPSLLSSGSGIGGLCSFTGDSGGEFSRPYLRLKWDGDRRCFLVNRPTPAISYLGISVNSSYPLLGLWLKKLAKLNPNKTWVQAFSNYIRQACGPLRFTYIFLRVLFSDTVNFVPYIVRDQVSQPYKSISKDNFTTYILSLIFYILRWQEDKWL
jgi:hypothetical protein